MKRFIILHKERNFAIIEKDIKGDIIYTGKNIEESNIPKRFINNSNYRIMEIISCLDELERIIFKYEPTGNKIIKLKNIEDDSILTFKYPKSNKIINCFMWYKEK